MMALIRRSIFLGMAAASLAVPSAGAQLPLPQPPVKPTAPSPLESISWMAGSWAAEAKPAGAPRPYKILTKFTPQLDGRVIAMETNFDGQLVYQGMYAFDPAKKVIAFWYVTPNGESIRGTVAPQGADQLYDFLMTLTNGIDLHFQTKVHLVDNDHYTWSLFTTINKGATWDKLFAVEYHRVP